MLKGVAHDGWSLHFHSLLLHTQLEELRSLDVLWFMSGRWHFKQTHVNLVKSGYFRGGETSCSERGEAPLHADIHQPARDSQATAGWCSTALEGFQPWCGGEDGGDGEDGGAGDIFRPDSSGGGGAGWQAGGSVHLCGCPACVSPRDWQPTAARQKTPLLLQHLSQRGILTRHPGERTLM